MPSLTHILQQQKIKKPHTLYFILLAAKLKVGLDSLLPWPSGMHVLSEWLAVVSLVRSADQLAF